MARPGGSPGGKDRGTDRAARNAAGAGSLLASRATHYTVEKVAAKLGKAKHEIWLMVLYGGLKAEVIDGQRMFSKQAIDDRLRGKKSPTSDTDKTTATQAEWSRPARTQPESSEGRPAQPSASLEGATTRTSDGYYSAEETAEKLGKDPDDIWEMVCGNQLPVFRINGEGMFPKQAVESLLNKGEDLTPPQEVSSRISPEDETSGPQESAGIRELHVKGYYYTPQTPQQAASLLGTNDAAEQTGEALSEAAEHEPASSGRSRMRKPMTEAALEREGLAGRINSAYEHLETTHRDSVNAAEALAAYERRAKVENAEILLEARNERSMNIYLAGILDTPQYLELSEKKTRTKLAHYEARVEVERLELLVRLLEVTVSEQQRLGAELKRSRPEASTTQNGLENEEVSLEEVAERIRRLPLKKETLPPNISAIRRSYARAYEPWSEQEDRWLAHHARVPGTSAKALCEAFQRHPGSINSRLKKLGI